MNNELSHHGIRGQKWGIRRFQSYPAGHVGGKEVGEAAKKKAERKEFRKDEKTRKQLNNQVRSTQKNLKFRARDMKDMAAAYDKESKKYAKAISRPVLGLTKKSRDTKRDARVQKEDAKLQELGKDMMIKQRNLERAKKVNANAVNRYKQHVGSMIEKYGDQKVSNVESKTVKIGKRQYDMIKTGVGITSMKYASLQEAALRREEVEELARGAHV